MDDGRPAGQCQTPDEKSSSVNTFKISLPDGELVRVHERPYLPEFLHNVSEKYETHISLRQANVECTESTWYNILQLSVSRVMYSRLGYEGLRQELGVCLGWRSIKANGSSG
jgi:hypothetical protein